MEINVKCHAIERTLTGHNDDVRFNYVFVPEIVFGKKTEGMQEPLIIYSYTDGIWELGRSYRLEIGRK